MSKQESETDAAIRRIQKLYNTYSTPSAPAHGLALQEGKGPWNHSNRSFSEHFLQIIWNEQCLAHNLSCVDGTALQIVNPGVWNVSSGPDFHSAALIFNGKLTCGDVEVHSHTSDWIRHRHSDTQAYQSVILHVVWEDDGPIPETPSHVLVLKNFLNPSWKVLLHEVEDACYPYACQIPPGKCALRWALTGNDKVKEILTAAGLARFDSKAAALARQAAQKDPEQAFYEAFFECLGYKNNKKAFRTLASEFPLSILREIKSLESLEALFFGGAGLLPDPTRTAVLPEWTGKAPRLWQLWWQRGAKRLSLNWVFAGTRPLNSPHRRLAAGVKWLFLTNFQPLHWLQTTAQSLDSSKELFKFFYSIDFDLPHWRACQNFQTAVSPPSALLGRQRIADIIANLFLPVLQAPSLPWHSKHAGELARNAFLLLPPMQENRPMKEASHRFLLPPSRAKEVLKRACHQQGLLYIYKNFCQNLDHYCANCPFYASATN